MYRKNFSSFLNAVVYCANFMWESSPFYTIMRLMLFGFFALIPFINIYATKFLIDSFIDNSVQLRQILLLLVIVLSGLGTYLCTQINSYMQIVHNDLMENKITESIMHKTSTIDMAFFDSPDYLDVLQAVMMDAAFLTNIVWNIFYAVSSLISLAFAVTAISQHYWYFATFLLIITLPSALMSHKYTKSLYSWRLDHLSEERKKAYIGNMARDRRFASDVRLFEISGYLIKRFHDLWVALFKERKHVQKKQVIALSITGILPEVCMLLFMVAVIEGIHKGVHSIGDLSLYIGLFSTLIQTAMRVVECTSAIYEDKMKVETTQNFISRENRVLDTGSIALTGNLRITFENVSFCYPNSDYFVLKNITFTIEPTEKVCLIGINGAGKSTIIKLLMRFYDVTYGRILINGRDIREYTLQSLRRSISTFFQDYAIYPFSLEENIRISDIEKNWGKERLETSMKFSGADKILSKLHNGYSTYIHKVFDKNGYEPSGGELQKISLARTIYRDCSFIIFDEPTAALDPISEHDLFESLKKIWENKGALFTSHRLAAVHLADKIILLEAGRVIESGSHRELMDLGDRYCKLYTLQTSKYAKKE